MMNDPKKANVKGKVEAILFSTGHKIKIDDICRLARAKREEVIEALHELMKEFDEKQSSLMLAEEGDSWKLTVRDQYVPMIRRIVTETELPKGVLETLAVIAFKYPILQSDLIKIRTNKAYDHLAELEAAGYISRQKQGRTNLIKLTEKFFKYFDLTEDKLREQFKDFDSIAKAIKEKEEEVEKVKGEQQKRAIELKQEDEKIRKEIESLDDADDEFGIPLEIYKPNKEETKEESPQDALEKNLPVKVEEQETELMNIEQKAQEDKQEEAKAQKIEDAIPVQQTQFKLQEEIGQEINQEEKTETMQENEPKKKKEKKRSKGIHLSPESEAAAEKKAQEIIQGGEIKEEKKSRHNENQD